MSRGRKIWRVGVRLGVCALLLFWIFHLIFVDEGKQALGRQGVVWDHLSRSRQWEAAWKYGSRELWRTLNEIKPGAFAAALALMGGGVMLGVFRWRLVLRLQGLELSVSRATEICFVAQFFNSFLLGSSGGDLMKAYYAARETHHKKAEAVATVFMDRLLGLFAMLLFATLMMVPNWGLVAGNPRMAVVAVVIAAMLLGCASAVGLVLWGNPLHRWPQARAWVRRLPKGELVERSLDCCPQFGGHPARLLKALGLALLLNVACVLQVWSLLYGVGLSVSPLVLCLIVPSIICIAALPITPSGLGVRENLYVLMLTAPQLHVEATKALSVSLLAFATSLFWSLAGGLVYLTFKETHHLTEVSPRAPGSA